MCLNQIAWLECDKCDSGEDWLVAYATAVGAVILVVESGVN